MDYAQLGWYLLPAVLAGLGFGYFLLPKDGWPLIGKRPPFWTLPFVIIFLALFFGVLVRLIANVFFEGSVDSINKLLLGLAGLLSAPFLVWRTWIADRQRHIGQEELYTGLLVRAVEQLGATREEKKSREISDGEGKTKVETITETVPNTEVRLGAIYALEKLARDYEPLHWPIMEILCAYVRKNAGPPTPCSDEVREAYAKQHKDYEIFDLESMNNYLEIVRRREAEIRPPLPDVQAALTVMGRRSKQQRDFEKRKSIEDDVAGEHSFRLDLSACNLGFVDLRGLHFEDANFERSCFECASLQGAHLNGAQFYRSYLEGAFLERAHLERALLNNAHLEGASLDLVWLEKALLIGAHLEGATLNYAHLERARLTRAHLKDAILEGTRLEGARFTWAQGLTEEQIAEAYGDANTTLPKGLSRPQNERWSGTPASEE